MDLKERREIIEEFKNNKKLGVKKRALYAILPMIEISYNPSFNVYHPYLIDCNICDKEINIILLFDNTYKDDGFKEIIFKLMKNSDYIKSDYSDDGTELKCDFNVPKEYLNDFYTFLRGEYSQFSEKYKEKLLKLYGKANSTVPNIYTWMDALYPSDEIRREKALYEEYKGDWRDIREVWSLPHLEHEKYYNLKELNEIYNKLKEQ